MDSRVTHTFAFKHGDADFAEDFDLAALRGLLCDLGYGKPRTLKDRFWRYIFVPTYKMLPNGLRQYLIHAMPGSHRRPWPKQSPRPRPPHPFVRIDGQDRSPRK